MNPWSLPKRIAEIKRVNVGKNEGSYPLFFRGTLSDYKIFKVSIEMPVYRLSNGRTIARQREYVVRKKVASDFFIKDPESIEALDAQHELLCDLAKDEGLLNYFKQPQTVQDEPIIIDDNGYIINGNRRICAMRMLLESNNKQYAKYEYVRVIILPDCSEDDIIRLEARLQTQPDIKADYSWIAEALLYKNQMDLYGYDYNRLARIHGKDKTEIQTLNDIVEYADEYLSSRGKPDQYSLIEKNREAFTQLRRYRKNFSKTQDKDIFKELVYSFIDNPADAPGRIYQTVKEIADNLATLKSDLTSEFEITPIEKKEEEHEKEDYSILTPVIPDPIKIEETAADEGIIDFIKTTKKPQELREAVIATIDLAKRKKKETKSVNAFRNNIKEAQAKLFDANACYNSNSKIDGVMQSIENIEEVIIKIRKLLE